MKKFCIEEILDAAIRFRGTMDEVPLEGFRYEVQSIIRNLGTAIGAPTNYILVEMMTAFGTALGKKFIIEDWTYKNFLTPILAYMDTQVTRNHHQWITCSHL